MTHVSSFFHAGLSFVSFNRCFRPVSREAYLSKDLLESVRSASQIEHFGFWIIKSLHLFSTIWNCSSLFNSKSPSFFWPQTSRSWTSCAVAFRTASSSSSPPTRSSASCCRPSCRRLSRPCASASARPWPPGLLAFPKEQNVGGRSCSPFSGC